MWKNYFILISILKISYLNGLFEGCDNKYILKENTVTYVESPYYPALYPSGSSCIYSFSAPLDYEILTECRISLNKSSTACNTEFFYISRDGDRNLTEAEQFCGVGNITRTTMFTKLVLAYISKAKYNSGIGGSFKCKLTTRPQACDCGWSQGTRIVGGVETGIGEFPSMVGLYNKIDKTVYCGGSIISHRVVLSVTHCIRRYPSVSDNLVVVGDHDLTSGTESKYAASYNIYAFVEHPNYDATNNINDISLIITTTNIEWSRGVGPMCLPLDQLTNTFDYEDVFVVGWGTLSFAGIRSNTLQKAAVNIIPNSVCKNVYSFLQPTQVCTFYENRDSCQFDSGGPVVHKGSARQFLLGAISSGFACGREPGVNTRITSYIPWIQRYPVGTLCPKPFN